MKVREEIEINEEYITIGMRKLLEEEKSGLEIEEKNVGLQEEGEEQQEKQEQEEKWEEEYGQYEIDWQDVISEEKSVNYEEEYEIEKVLDLEQIQKNQDRIEDWEIKDENALETHLKRRNKKIEEKKLKPKESGEIWKKINKIMRDLKQFAEKQVTPERIKQNINILYFIVQNGTKGKEIEFLKEFMSKVKTKRILDYLLQHLVIKEKWLNYINLEEIDKLEKIKVEKENQNILERNKRILEKSSSHKTKEKIRINQIWKKSKQKKKNQKKFQKDKKINLILKFRIKQKKRKRNPLIKI